MRAYDASCAPPCCPRAHAHVGRVGALRRCSIVLLLASVLACGNSTGPSTHFAIVAHILVPGGPIDVAVLESGLALVTRGGVDSVQELNLANSTVGSAVAVGVAPTFVIFGPTGGTAYVSNQLSDNIGVIDVATGVQTDFVPVTGDPIPMQITADGHTLFVTTNANRLYRVDLATKTATDSLDLPATSHHLLLRSDGARLYVATRDGGSVLEVDPSTLAVLRTFTLGGRTQAMAFSPDGTLLYVANETKPLVQTINLTSGVLGDSATLAGGANGIALDVGGSRIFASIIFAGKVQIINRTTMTVDTTIVTGGTPRAVVSDAPRQQIVVANEGGWVDVIR